MLPLGVDGIDRLLFNALTKSIEEQISKEKIGIIDQRLSKEHGMRFADIIYQFDMAKSLHGFEMEMKGIEDEILRDFVTVARREMTHGSKSRTGTLLRAF